MIDDERPTKVCFRIGNYGFSALTVKFKAGSEEPMTLLFGLACYSTGSYIKKVSRDSSLDLISGLFLISAAQTGIENLK